MSGPSLSSSSTSSIDNSNDSVGKKKKSSSGEPSETTSARKNYNNSGSSTGKRASYEDEEGDALRDIARENSNTSIDRSLGEKRIVGTPDYLSPEALLGLLMFICALISV